MDDGNKDLTMPISKSTIMKLGALWWLMRHAHQRNLDDSSMTRVLYGVEPPAVMVE
jgi:hypothetical protein